MKCEICHCDPDQLVSLPIRQNNGPLETFACLDCSNKSEHFCRSHKRPHMGFSDNTSVCFACVFDEVDLHWGKIASKFVDCVNSSLNKKRVKEVVKEYLELLLPTDKSYRGHIREDNEEYYEARARLIARPIVCFYMRTKMSIEDCLRHTVNYPEHVFLGIPPEEN